MPTTQDEAGTIKLAMVLRRNARSPDAIEVVTELAETLGLVRTAAGAATVSFKMNAQDFERLFDVAVAHTDAIEATDKDFGSPGGYSQRQDAIRIPESLVPYVASISVEGPYIRLKNDTVDEF